MRGPWLGGILKTGFLALVLALCLFGDCPAVKTAPVIGGILNEIVAAGRDPSTQWMVALCLLTYLGTFLLLERRLSSGTPFWRADNAVLWLAGFVALGALHYALDYKAAVHSTQFLTLLAGLVLGRGAAVGFRWAENRPVPTDDEGSEAGGTHRALRRFLASLTVLLLIAALWHPENPRRFTYLGQARWSGPWDNPNTYGLLVGTGLVLAVGLAVSEMLDSVRGKPGRRRPPGRHRIRAIAWSFAAILLAGCLLKSFSRGAWLGTALALVYLSLQVVKLSGAAVKERETHKARPAPAEVTPVLREDSWLEFAARNRTPLMAAMVAAGILALGFARQTDWLPARRVLSVANQNDFSWRNRVAAWEGALQIMADYPGWGVGWNQPETVYNQFYRPPRIEEGMAIQLNDYFTLGMTLGLPALVCLAGYVGLSYRPRSMAGNASLEERVMKFDVGLRTRAWLPIACRAGAIVLLVGAGFDGGMFKLPTAVLLWTLLEAGTLVHRQKEGRSRIEAPRGFGGATFVAVPAALILGGALIWAHGRDPFMRVWFDVEVAGQPKVGCLAVLPKPVQPRPVVLYLHGAGGSLRSDGPDLRPMAELGLAVVSVEYDQTNAASGDWQFAAVLSHLRQQRWADSSAVAWAGFDLGANRVLGYALRQPQGPPRLLVALAGGREEELKQLESASRPPPLREAAPPRFPVLLVHGGEDEGVAAAKFERAAAGLRDNGIVVERKALAGLPHTFGADRGVVFRAVSERILTQLAGSKVWTGYRSLAQWKADATPLWVRWLPAAFWLGGGAARAWSARRRVARPQRTFGRMSPAGLGLRFGAGALVLAAAALIGMEFLLPQLPITDSTLALARRFLVPAQARVDLDWLAAQPISKGWRVRTLTDQVSLANYNRGLVNWQIDEARYREFVLSPLIDDGRTADAAWRRPLWESLYPRIRKEPSPAAAAQVVVRHLRERVTILPGPHRTADLATVWRRQLADQAGFARLVVAALRSVGIAARLTAGGGAEYWNTESWVPAPPLAMR